jgi:hypothetical protein
MMYAHMGRKSTPEAIVPLAGGRPLKTPFGTFRTPNITPDPTHGIGKWSEAEFVRALREGGGRQGEPEGESSSNQAASNVLGVAPAISPDARFRHPAFRSLDAGLAPQSLLRSASNAARLSGVTSRGPLMR